MSIKFNKLAYNSVDDFVYGSCKKPVTTKSGLVIGCLLYTSPSPRD